MHKIKLDEVEADQTANPTQLIQPQEQLDEPVKAINNEEPMKKTPLKLTLIVIFLATAAGAATGYGGYKLRTKSSGQTGRATASPELQRVATENQIQVGDVFGVEDEKTFSDQAQGYLEKGGINGEGSHKLLRAGGESQTVYLTSSITDLDKFANMEIKIWGETFKGQKASWLMDVGRVEVVQTEGEVPSEN